MQYLQAVKLLELAIENELLQTDGESNIYLYRKACEAHEEGWFLSNIFDVAQELISNEENAKEFLAQLEDNGIDTSIILGTDYTRPPYMNHKL